MNRQLAFNDAFLGLHNQGCPSVSVDFNNNDCLYRDENGNACAIGMLIPDDKYTVDLEAKPADDVTVLEALDKKYGDINFEEDGKFLDNMQLILHDSISDKFNKTILLKQAREFAKVEGLKMPEGFE